MSLVGCSQPLTLRQRICFLHIIRATVRFTPEGDARDAIRDVRFGSKADIGLSPVDVRHSPKGGHLDVAAKVCERGSEAFPASAAALRKRTGPETLALDRARRHHPRDCGSAYWRNSGENTARQDAVISGNVEQRP
jgi:hypothetical protein